MGQQLRQVEYGFLQLWLRNFQTSSVDRQVLFQADSYGRVNQNTFDDRVRRSTLLSRLNSLSRCAVCSAGSDSFKFSHRRIEFSGFLLCDAGGGNPAKRAGVR